MFSLEYTTEQEGIERLKQHVDLRNQMLGGLNWQIVNNECTELANKLRDEGANLILIADIMENTVSANPKPYTDNPAHDPTYDPSQTDELFV